MEKMPNFDLERKNIQKTNQNPVLRIRIRMIRKILASWIHGSGSMGQNINQKLQKQILLSKPKSELLKKRDIKISFPDF